MNIEELQPSLNIVRATLEEYSTIQNMARFYQYELSRDCGFISENWAFTSDGLYPSLDFKNYFEESTRNAFLIKIGNELAGFALINQEGIDAATKWNMGEFFITAKFQGKGLGFLVFSELCKQHQGLWEVSVIPQNKRGLNFWRRAIEKITMGNFQEKIKTINYDPYQPKRVIFCFESKSH